MRYIDMHCDTLMSAYFDKNPEGVIRGDNLHTDFDRMKNNVMAQFFAIFLPPRGMFERRGIGNISDDEYIDALRSIFQTSLNNDNSVHEARNAGQIEKNDSEGFPSAVLTMEDGRAVSGELGKIKTFYNMGFRAISLTWNHANCFGSPNSDDPAVMNAGLTDFGKDGVRYMQELGILVDVSHLSDGGFWDVADICKKPFIASHSNARAVSPHKRNLTDDMIKALADAGGVTGLNFCPPFVEPDAKSENTSSVMLARHARHIADVGGVDCVAIGTDFDGFHGDLDVNDCSKMDILYRELLKQGFTENEVEKIAYKNVLRVMKDAIN